MVKEAALFLYDPVKIRSFLKLYYGNLQKSWIFIEICYIINKFN